MSGKRGSGSGPFLMEMIFVTGFFIICAAFCVTVFARAVSMSRRARDINQAVLAAETLAEEIKAGETEALGDGLPLVDRDYYGHLTAWWNSEDGAKSRDRAEQIQAAADFTSYAPVWDSDWNRYPDAGALPEGGEIGYTAQVLCGTVDHMQMTEIVVMRYERGAGDKNTVLYALSADQYVKPCARPLEESGRYARHI